MIMRINARESLISEEINYFMGKDMGFVVIRFAEEADKEQIKKLWRESFGDGESEVQRYIDRYCKYILVYVDRRRITAMLSMLPLTRNGEKGRYIYAVATSPEERGRGIATRLLAYANEFILKNGEKFSVLVPAEKKLFKFYEKRGYVRVSSVRQIEPQVLGFSKSGFDVKKISAQRLFELRHKFFKNKNFIEWGKEELEYIGMIYFGEFYELTGEEGSAFAVCSFSGGMLDIKELCTDGLDRIECVSALNGIFNASHIRLAVPDDEAQASCMIFPETMKNSYFNLAMD